jgi:preprotein translocase subunit SecA
MRAATLPIPGIVLGAYPERRGDSGSRASIHRTATFGTGRRNRSLRLLGAGRHYRRIAERAAAISEEIAELDEAATSQRLQSVRSEMAMHGLADHLVCEAMGLVGKFAHDTLGKQPYVTQLTAAAIMLDGKLAEMATGEGKTLAAAVCAATAALAGIPVHVMTANDYLVARDAKTLAPLYRALRLSVGSVVQQSDRNARRTAYACNVTYCTARQLAFDYLRDRMLRGRLRNDLELRAAELTSSDAKGALLRGLCMAIVDEADSILIDEAGVPLILSERSANAAETGSLRHALDAAREMDDRHYRLQPAQMKAELTQDGRDLLEQQIESAESSWHNRRHREEVVSLALAALHLFQRDKHYLVRDEQVEIIDETTGRIASGRQWSRGLHQLIELKEGCRPREPQYTAAQITYQRFFRRYLHLAGLSGTLQEACGELRSVYRLRVVKVPTRLPSRRKRTTYRLYPDRTSRWDAIAARAHELSQSGQPVLIGTGSVADSDELSRRLSEADVGHAVLNARQDAAEAELVAAAGQTGRITVATNMAGRGTDIELGPSVTDGGGLHVICCQHNVSARIDRQLIGRSARQGDPGSADIMLAADAPQLAPWIPLRLRQRIPVRGIGTPRWLIRLLLCASQLIEEVRRRDQRHALLLRDQQQERGRVFGRPVE